MKLSGPWKLLPIAFVAISILSACGNTNYTKQTQGATVTANQYVTTKPKIDVIIFQDNSDSVMNGPINTLRPQMYTFLTNMSNQWDYRFTVMPLLSAGNIRSKYVVATDCSSVTGVLQCFDPSQSNSFNYSSGDYGWINSVNSAIGSNDRGFQYTQYNLEQMRSSGFVRSDAALAIIVLSNGDDLQGVSTTTRSDGVQILNYNTADASNSFNSYSSYFYNIKGSGGSVLSKFYSVVAPGACMGGYYGQRYTQMSNTLGSRAYSICNSELNVALESIRQQLVAVTQAVIFNYIAISPDSEPLVSSIKITKNGASIPQSSSNGWTYIGYQSNMPTSYSPTAGNNRSGYMVQLNGTAQYKGSDVITFDFVKK